MFDKVDLNVLKNAIELFGVDNQRNVAIEEMSELTKELCKQRRCADNRYQIVEELVDVYITLQQICIMNNIGV